MFLWVCAMVVDHCQQCNDKHTNDFFFSVRELDTTLSPLAIRVECAQTSVFCYIFVIVDRSRANTRKCLVLSLHHSHTVIFGHPCADSASGVSKLVTMSTGGKDSQYHGARDANARVNTLKRGYTRGFEERQQSFCVQNDMQCLTFCWAQFDFRFHCRNCLFSLVL